jgi:hypothetical protein
LQNPFFGGFFSKEKEKVCIAVIDLGKAWIALWFYEYIMLQKLLWGIYCKAYASQNYRLSAVLV